MGETPETVSVMSGHSSAHWDASPRYTESLIGLSCSRERSARGGCPRSSRARRPPYLRDWSATDFLTSSRDGHAALFGEGSVTGYRSADDKGTQVTPCPITCHYRELLAIVAA